MITNKTTDLSDFDFNQGVVILINKPKNWTSFKVVDKVKKLIKAKKVGHAGTLDPKATGLLILCTGKLTKSIEEFQNQIKEYRGKIYFGKTTPTMDMETINEASEENDISHLNIELIKKQRRNSSVKLIKLRHCIQQYGSMGKELMNLHEKVEILK